MSIQQAINAIGASHSARTRKKCHQHLLAALDVAVNFNVIAMNPARKIKVAGAGRSTASATWTENEAATFLRAARCDPFYDLFRLYLSTGLRRGEALGTPWWAVDLGQGTIRIEQEVVEFDDQFGLSTLKTEHSKRTIHIDEQLCELFASRRQAQERLGGSSKAHDLVFTTRNGTPIRPSNVFRSLKRLIRPLDVRSIRLHDLRHTYATLALIRGIPVEIVSKNLGHSNVSITLNLYRHVLDHERKSAFLSFPDPENPEDDE